MGVLRWLDRISPETWHEATERIVKENVFSADSATRFLAAFGKKPSEFLLESLEDVGRSEEERCHVRNSVLAEAVSEEHWSLGKSLGKGLNQIFLAVPEMRPLAGIDDFSAMDLETPDECESDSGLFGCCSTEALKRMLEPIERFDSLRAVGALIARKSPKLVSGFAGRGGSAPSRFDDEHLEEDWQKIRTAVRTCTKSGSYLGLGMSA